jgi:hypothetical protein
VATALNALIAGDVSAGCAAEGFDFMLVHGDLGGLALWALRDTFIDHHRPPCTEVLGSASKLHPDLRSDMAYL